MTGSSLNQMSAKAGIRKRGDKAIEALLTEFMQLHDTKTFEPMFAHRLTRNQKRKALHLLSLIKEKGTVK